MNLLSDTVVLRLSDSLTCFDVSQVHFSVKEMAVSVLVMWMVTSGHAFHNLQMNSNGKAVYDVSKVNMMSCGVPKVRKTDIDKIVGGRDAFTGEFPWQVSLRYKSWFHEASHMCGASVINELWIVTAAHCVKGISRKNLDVVVGLHELGKVSEHTQTHEIAKVICHSDFNFSSTGNDIALLRVQTPIEMAQSDGYVNGICLPKPNQIFDGFAVASGWGTTTEDGSLSPVLQAVELSLVPHKICRAIYGENLLSKTMICAGEPEGGKDTCSGDSGGPLVQFVDGKAVLLGISSFGIGCGREGLPGIYTSVSDFIPWILTNIT